MLTHTEVGISLILCQKISRQEMASMHELAFEFNDNAYGGFCEFMSNRCELEINVHIRREIKRLNVSDCALIYYTF